MARQPGTKAENAAPGDRLRRSIGRGVGFVILAGLAMAIVAPLVLMPAWADLIRAEYDLAVKSADIEHNRQIVAAGARLRNALPHDPVVNARLVKGVVRQDLVHAPPVRDPPKPSGW